MWILHGTDVLVFGKLSTFSSSFSARGLLKFYPTPRLAMLRCRGAPLLCGRWLHAQKVMVLQKSFLHRGMPFWYIFWTSITKAIHVMCLGMSPFFSGFEGVTRFRVSHPLFREVGPTVDDIHPNFHRSCRIFIVNSRTSRLRKVQMTLRQHASLEDRPTTRRGVRCRATLHEDATPCSNLLQGLS